MHKGKLDMKLSRQAKAMVSEMNTKVASIKDVKRGSIDPQINIGISNLCNDDYIDFESTKVNQRVNEIFKAWYVIKDNKQLLDKCWSNYNKLSFNLSESTLEYLNTYFKIDTSDSLKSRVIAYQVMEAVNFYKSREFDRKGYTGLIRKIALYNWNTYKMHDYVNEVGYKKLSEIIEKHHNPALYTILPYKAICNGLPLKNLRLLIAAEFTGSSYKRTPKLGMPKDQIRKLTLLQAAFADCKSSRLSQDLGMYFGGTDGFKGLSIAEVRFLIQGLKFWTNARMGTHIRNVSPAVFVILGKLQSNELRYAALHELKRVSYDIDAVDLNKSSRFKYCINKRSINWECVKEIQDLMLSGKSRMILNHASQPKARKFFKEHGVYVRSKNIPEIINIKALNLMKKEEIHLLAPAPMQEAIMLDTINIANIFGIHAVDALTKPNPGNRGKYVNPHTFVNCLNISPVNHVLSQQWNQFFYKNEELARYAGFVKPDLKVFKSKEQFSHYVRTQRYTDVPVGFEHLIELCARHELSNNSFNKFVERVKNLTNKTSEMLPSVRIDGSTVEGVNQSYTIDKLDADDPAVLLIGLDTSCCQHIGGAGSSCAIHSYEKADSAVYVVRKQGQIIAQSWVWRNKDNGVVFDSIEVNISERNNLEPIAYMFKELANQLIGKLMIDSVYVGNTNYGMTGLVLNTIGKLTGSPCRTRMISHCSYMDGDSHYLVSASESFIKKHLTFNGDVLAVCA